MANRGDYTFPKFPQIGEWIQQSGVRYRQVCDNGEYFIQVATNTSPNGLSLRSQSGNAAISILPYTSGLFEDAVNPGPILS